jgi:hypothetical protein
MISPVIGIPAWDGPMTRLQWRSSRNRSTQRRTPEASLRLGDRCGLVGQRRFLSPSLSRGHVRQCEQTRGNTGHEFELASEPNRLLESLPCGVHAAGRAFSEAEVPSGVRQRQPVARRGGDLVRVLQRWQRSWGVTWSAWFGVRRSDLT